MKVQFSTVNDYVNALEPDRKIAVQKLRDAVNAALPKDFEECISYNMIAYVVPHSVYPNGYHCDPKIPLPFMNIASQKNFIALYHMGIYADNSLLDWFVSEYGKRVPGKLDMGKSCIRFKKIDQIPFDLISELASKISAQQWIDIYEGRIKK
ncbi:MAG: DUF1801 domain-containing protein [Cryomorphaceae bacterium]|nr:DUF1801 domain-containing protein [Cryomorphaceae bacterium]